MADEREPRKLEEIRAMIEDLEKKRESYYAKGDKRSPVEEIAFAIFTARIGALK